MMQWVSRLSLVFVAISVAGCMSPHDRLDPSLRWQQAEQGLPLALESAEQIQWLRNEYEAVIFLDREGELRGRAFLRLAELDLAQHKYPSARESYEQALRAGINPPSREEHSSLSAIYSKGN